MPPDVNHILSHFDLAPGHFTAIPYGTGHINDTYRVTYNQGGIEIRYILQRINHQVFTRPDLLMENILNEEITCRPGLLEAPRSIGLRLDFEI